MNRTIIVAIMMVSGIGANLWGQCMLSGTVANSKGEPLSGANVWISEIERGTETGENGRYCFESLPEGTYQIRFSYLGFETIRKRVEIQTGM
ncbi:MAG: carboxypeptidase-like regulatory domain-containing protein, partial [Saprospiraceae bacterium]|nr:carboxypeptidase-like regulatory domain-containing protein [Saprospiraceae bacterium]